MMSSQVYSVALINGIQVFIGGLCPLILRRNESLIYSEPTSGNGSGSPSFKFWGISLSESVRVYELNRYSNGEKMQRIDFVFTLI